MLVTSYKGCYPFRLACPSFVYPANYTENVERLGPYVDEIELLFLEGAPASRPDPALIDDLLKLGRMHSISYNVHLPIDVGLGHPSRANRQQAIEALGTVMQSTRRLQPRCWVLHIHPGPSHATPIEVAGWQQRVSGALPSLLAHCDTSRQLAVENLDYPFAWGRPLIEAHDLGVCLDIGHALLAQEPIDGLLSREAARAVMLHIHGVRAGRDHRPLAELPSREAASLIRFLTAYRGGVVVEVFDFVGLQNSLSLLEQWLASAGPADKIGR